MDDYISRQKLLKDIEEYHVSDGKFQHWVEVQPSAPVREVKLGRWITKEGDVAFYDVCSVCGAKVLHRYPYWNFCPNCGEYMKEK